MNNKDIKEWTKKDFQSLPHRKWNEDIGFFDSLVILPTKAIHDSGYSCMDFVAVKKGIPICRLSGCSDVVHIDGIGGGGMNYNFTNHLAKSWSIDCLPRSGLLRLFSPGHSLEAAPAHSSFEIFATKRKNQ